MKISVVGLGKLGSPLLAVLASKGHDLIGVDLNREIIEQINQRMAPVKEPGLQELISSHHCRIKAILNSDEAVQNSDVTFVIVPTPSEENGFFTNRYILQSLQSLGSALIKKSAYHLVVISSTVMPGSTGGEIRETLEAASNRKIGVHLGLCYSPEFIALGSAIKNLLFPDMILIGESDKKAGDLLESIYLSVCEKNPPIKRMNFINAEIAKIALNTFVTAKVSFANMLSDLCQRLDGGDVDAVTAFLGLDSRVGEKFLKGAVAFGGPCFPRDNIALGALAREVGARFDLAHATQEINRYQTQRLLDLVEKYGKGKRVGILGLSYKPGTYVVEESQGMHIAQQLSEKGYTISAYDPMAMGEAKKWLKVEIQMTSSVRECLMQSDIVLILTAWPEFSREITPAMLKEFKGRKVLIDCWRLLSRTELGSLSDLVYLGYGNNPAVHSSTNPASKQVANKWL